ncbi:bifunctional 2-polyprenyl-6-hydroxyphenol methylase/3-demethylubiquinol 3-O-methyltransferase UbiG [Thiomicrospira sp. ALE5]|uniref:class I SAM-dependent methyltransferase n=1 Tax=Thiomicrospira sp. ALE5 TaxID=748650 RepID=UPI0008E39045|nr:class I SAM-dependent methyltransferase [Thiomicrospira sp. ALE5]SFR49548.1 Methyltransferase domain-containing protein [Thiomicrospira sp. ALE5]
MPSVRPSHVWTAKDLVHHQPRCFDADILWLDTRDPADFLQVRFERAFLWHWPKNLTCLNQLPSRDLALGLIATPDLVLEYQAWLAAKGYKLKSWLSPEQFLQLNPAHWPKVSGPQRQRLWQANAFLLQQVSNAALFAQNNRLHALDLGCGGGREAVALARRGWHVVAVDNQPPALTCARDLAQAEQVSVDFRLADLTQPQQRPTEKFDLIYQLRFLDRHLFDYIEHHLKPGGYVLIETFREGVQAFGSPKNPRFILQPGELANRFRHFDIIVDKLTTLPDGRPMNAFLARKPTC